MLRRKHSVRKYIVSTVLITAFVFTPLLSGTVFAHGGPDTEANQNDAPINEQVDQKETFKTNPTVISVGNRGEAVKDVQTALNNHGHHLNTDGIFGPKTDEAVRAFQADKALSVDGIAGPDTKEALAINASTTDGELKIKEAPNEQTKSETTTQSEVVSIAESLIGSPYQFGGTTPAGFDSSGFINYVFAQVGVQLDRTHAAMWENNGVHVDSPSVGDVVFFKDTYKEGISHSGIYIGNNQMIHAGTEKTGVEVTTLSYDYWQNHYVGAKSLN